MTRVLAAALVLALIDGAVGSGASAQTTQASNRHRIEASIGGLWVGGTGMGSEPAEIRANNATTPTPFRLFTTETTLDAAPGFDARVGYWLTHTIGVELGFVRAQPDLRTDISGDAEGAAALSAAERLDQYFVDVSGVWLVNKLRFRQRTVPFVSGGVGYLRQLHEGRTQVETGQVYQVGGGVRHELLTRLGWIRSMGVRLQGRLYVLVDGVQLEDEPRRHGAFSGAVYLVF